jgi:hypothetical protein
MKEDLARTRSICTDLLGPNSVADDKTEYGTRLDMIGYTIDLSTSPDRARVLIARENFLTALHGFISTDTSKLTTRPETGFLGDPLRHDLPGDAPLLRGAEQSDVGKKLIS